MNKPCFFFILHILRVPFPLSWYWNEWFDFLLYIAGWRIEPLIYFNLQWCKDHKISVISLYCTIVTSQQKWCHQVVLKVQFGPRFTFRGFTFADDLTFWGFVNAETCHVLFFRVWILCRQSVHFLSVSNFSCVGGRKIVSWPLTLRQ